MKHIRLVSATTILFAVVLLSIIACGGSGYIRFVLYRDRYIIDLSMYNSNGVSSILVSGVVGGSDSLTVNLQFYTTDNIIHLLLGHTSVNIESVSIRAQKYSRFSLYKFNGTINARVDDKPLTLLLVFDILVSGNDSLEKVEVRGTITPVSSSREFNLAVLTVIDGLVKYFFRVLENISLGMVEAKDISIDSVPTPSGISVRVDALLEVREPDNAWRIIVNNFTGTMVLDYIDTLFDERLGDYAFGLDLLVKNGTISGNMTMLFDKGFEKLLDLNHTLLSSDFIITYYEIPGKSTLNVSGMVLKPRDNIDYSLREMGLLLYRLIGNTSVSIIIVSNDLRINTENIPLKPSRYNESYAEWNTSVPLLYLDRVILEGQQSPNYVWVLVIIAVAAVGLFYVIRRVSWK